MAGVASAGVDVYALAVQLQDEGAKAFVKSWDGSEERGSPFEFFRKPWRRDEQPTITLASFRLF